MASADHVAQSRDEQSPVTEVPASPPAAAGDADVVPSTASDTEEAGATVDADPSGSDAGEANIEPGNEPTKNPLRRRRRSRHSPSGSMQAADVLVAGRHPSSMVTVIGRLTSWVLARLMSGVVFGNRSIQAIKDAESQGTVVYVMRSRSLVDYIYFNVAFRQHGIGLVRFANGINTWVFRPFWRALSTLIRGRRGLPRDPDSFSALVRAGAPTMLFLSRARSPVAEREQFSLPYVARAVQAQRNGADRIQVVPLLLLWDKHPGRDEPTLIDEVFGTSHDPGFFRKTAQLVTQTWESFLNLGAPQVEVSAPIDLESFVENRAGASDIETARSLTAALSERLDRERRIIVGPGVKSARQIRQEILTDPNTVDAIRQVSVDTGQDIAKLQKRAGDALKAIAAEQSLFVVKVLSSLLSAVFHQIYDGMEIDEAGLDRIRDVARRKRIVLVPSHKSHIDYLVLSYIFYQSGLIPPHIAAGDNLSFWPLGPIFRRAGAFFLRRSFGDDPLYPRIFNAYLVQLLEEGFYLEFFIEGTRSRTGKLNPPKYGMLNMLVEAYRTRSDNAIAFVPVSVGYENIVEGTSYQRELEGAEKKSESLGGLLKTSQVLVSRYGRVYVEFGEPIDLGAFLAHHHPEGFDRLPREELDRSVRRLAYRIIHHINDVTTVTPSALAALTVLNNPAKAMDRETLIREVGFVLSFLQERNARLSGTLRTAVQARYASIKQLRQTPIDVDAFDEFDRDFVEDAAAPEVPAQSSVVRRTDEAIGLAVLPTVEEALRLLEGKKLVEAREVGDEQLYCVAEDRRAELAFYKNNIIHYFVPEAVFATGLFVVEGTRIEIDDIRAYARFLSRLLKYDFCFEERDHFERVFEKTQQYFLDRGWVTESPDGEAVEVTDPPPAGAEFLRGLLVPAVEGYYLAARVLLELGEEWVDAKALSRRMISRGRAMHLKGELIHGESVAKATIENALRVFREWGVVERADRGGRKREIQVTEEYRGPLLEELCDELGAMVAHQTRRPGELLRRV